MPTIKNIAIDADKAVRLRRNTESAPGVLTAKKLTPDEMGRELIFTISRNKFDEFKSLLKLGANPNYIEDPKLGYTLLDYLFLYGNCDTRYLEFLLDAGAKITINSQGLLPYAMAEKNCNATQLEGIKYIFDNQTQNLKKSTENNETGLIPYRQQKLAITISIPAFSFFSGVLAGGLEEVAQRNKEQYPYLPNFIFYVLQPISLAIGSAAMNSLLVGNAVSVGLEDAWLSFAFYLGINYFGLMFAQLGEKFTKKIQNKVLNLLIPIVLYTFYLNPNLLFNLLNEAFEKKDFQAIMMPLSATLSGGILFKTGEYVAQKTIGKFFPVNTPGATNNGRNYFSRFSAVDNFELNLSSEGNNEMIETTQLGTFDKTLPPPPTVEELQELCGNNRNDNSERQKETPRFANIRR